MEELNYLVYDGSTDDCDWDLVAGFVYLDTAWYFAESWRGSKSPVPVSVFERHTGRIMGTWRLGKWENYHC
jgi:hypothetical protein